MVKFTDIKRALRSQALDSLTGLVQEYIAQESDGFDQVLRQMMYLAANEQYGFDPPHALIYLDAIRDLSTLYEDTAQNVFPLMRSALQYFCTLDLEEWDQDLTGVKPEYFGESVMVSDLEKCVRNGEREQALRETARLLLMMDNPFYLVEILVEIGATAEESNGWPLILASATLKSVDFVGSARIKPIVFFFVDYLTRLQIGRGARNRESNSISDINFKQLYQSAVTDDTAGGDSLIYLTHAQQVWDGVRMKAGEIRTNIASQIRQRFDIAALPSSDYHAVDSSGLSDIRETLTEGRPEKIVPSALGYLKDSGGPGSLFIEFTEYFLSTHHTEDAVDLIRWNAYRTALAYTGQDAQPIIIADAVKFLFREN